MTGEMKREMEIKEFECPFCGFKKPVTVHDRLFNEETGEETGYGIDYWDCDGCGAENDIELENFEDNYRAFREFTDNDDWKGLHDFCKNKKFDDFLLSCLAKLYNQQKQFEKAINIAKIMLEIDNRDPDAEIIIRNAELGIKNRKVYQ